MGNRAQKWPKIGFLDFWGKLSLYFLLEMAENEESYGWLTFCSNSISRKILILQIYERKLSTNQIARFFKLLSFEPFNRFLYFFCIKIEYHKTFSLLKMMMSLFWKNACFPPKKGQKGAKVGGAVGKNQLFCIFLKIGSLDFFWYFA